MTDSLRSKLEGLIARAVHENTPIEEAQVAALIAVKLMVKYKVRILPPGEGPGLGSIPPTPPAGGWYGKTANPPDIFADFLSSFFGSVMRRTAERRSRVVDPNRVQDEVDEAFRKWNAQTTGAPSTRAEKKRRQRQRRKNRR